MSYLFLLLACNPIPLLLELNTTVYAIMQQATADASQCNDEKCKQDWEKTMSLLGQIERAMSDRILQDCPMEKADR